MQLDEADVVRRLQRGDEAAFDALYDAYAGRALRTAYLITRSQAVAEDVVQEAFEQALRSIRSLRDVSAFRPWFFRIVVNRARRLVRGPAARFQALDLGRDDRADPTAPEPEEMAESREELGRLRAALDGLKSAYRLVLVLRYFTGLTEQQVAQVLGLPLGTAKSRLNAARKALRERLEAGGAAGAAAGARVGLTALPTGRKGS